MYAEVFCLIPARNYDAFRAGNKTEITLPQSMRNVCIASTILKTNLL